MGVDADTKATCTMIWANRAASLWSLVGGGPQNGGSDDAPSCAAHGLLQLISKRNVSRRRPIVS